MKQKLHFINQIILLLLLACGAGQVKEEYRPFEESCTWSVNFIKYRSSGDTTIAGNSYLKVYRKANGYSPYEFDISQSEYFCAIRNDTAHAECMAFTKKQRKSTNGEAWNITLMKVRIVPSFYCMISI